MVSDIFTPTPSTPRPHTPASFTPPNSFSPPPPIHTANTPLPHLAMKSGYTTATYRTILKDSPKNYSHRKYQRPTNNYYLLTGIFEKKKQLRTTSKTSRCYIGLEFHFFRKHFALLTVIISIKIIKLFNGLFTLLSQFL